VVNILTTVSPKDRKGSLDFLALAYFCGVKTSTLLISNCQVEET
jgi:hypothetical protein